MVLRGKANNWLSSYVKNSTQFVTINGLNSELKEINCGVPQGSKLGPLFLYTSMISIILLDFAKFIVLLMTQI